MKTKLFDLLYATPPFPRPPMYSSKTASSTRDVAGFEYAYTSKQKLDGVVFQRSLVDQLLPKARLWVNHLEVDDKSKRHAWWFYKVSPKGTHLGMPKIIHGEPDSSKWFDDILNKPALHALRARIANRLTEESNPFNANPGISSCHGKKGFPTPDFGLWDGVILNLTEELKTDNSCPANTFQSLQTVRKDPDDSRRPLAVPFDWPVNDGSRVPKDTRILVQVSLFFYPSCLGHRSQT